MSEVRNAIVRVVLVVIELAGVSQHYDGGDPLLLDEDVITTQSETNNDLEYRDLAIFITGDREHC